MWATLGTFGEHKVPQHWRHPCVRRALVLFLKNTKKSNQWLEAIGSLVYAEYAVEGFGRPDVKFSIVTFYGTIRELLSFHCHHPLHSLSHEKMTAATQDYFHIWSTKLDKNLLVRPVIYQSWSKIKMTQWSPCLWAPCLRGGCQEVYTGKGIQIQDGSWLGIFSMSSCIVLILKALPCKAFHAWGSKGCGICFTLALVLLSVSLWTSSLLSLESLSLKDLDAISSLHGSGPLLGISYNIDWCGIPLCIMWIP